MKPCIFPAVDLRGGRCVRLLRGARGAETAYGDDPVAAARRWVEKGAEWIHAIDLGGAFGEPDNLAAVLAIARAVKAPVQAGGGLRDAERVARLLDGGIARVILGTRALVDPGFLDEALKRHGASRIVLALDVAQGRVKLKGWEIESGMDLAAGLGYAAAHGVERLLVTAIDQDGTLEGPSLSVVRQALDRGQGAVLAAGGIGSLDDIRALFDLRDPRLDGVVVGRALYEGAVKLDEAVRLSKEYET